MSIVANLNTKVVIQGGVAGLNAARRMAEFSYLIQQPLNVEAFVYPPDAGKTYDLPFGSTIVPVPVYRSVKEAAAKHPVNMLGRTAHMPQRWKRSKLPALNSCQ